jgi:hypothetical protein
MMRVTMHVTVARPRFDGWVREIGTKRAAEHLRCDPSFVSHLRRGTKTPGLETAILIERATSDLVGGPIRCSDWEIANAPAPAHSSPTGEAA